MRRFVAMTALAPVRWCRLYEAVCEAKLYLSSARWQYVSDHAKDLVRQMLTASAEESLTVEEALNHRCGVNIIVSLISDTTHTVQVGEREGEVCPQDPPSRDRGRA